MIKRLILIFAFLLVSENAFALPEDINLSFFQKFNDSCLNYYINQSLANNHDLKQAGYVVEQFRQQAKYSLGKELPSFSVSANYLGVHVPKLDNFQLKQNAFVLPFLANYEADFLLKNRDKTRSAKKAFEASKYEEKALYISLISDVASVYTNILQYDNLIQSQKEMVSINQELLNSDKRKYSRGVITNSQLNISKKNLENAKSSLETLQKEEEILLMQLAVLSGISPDCAKNLKRGSLKNFEYPEIIPDEISSDIIFSRPDVMEAETKLEKAKIDIRIARKEFLPTFNITGVWIFNTIAPGTFFSWESSLAAILAGASQDIFKGGMKVANLRLQKAKYGELFEEYKQTDLEAVKEVNTSLCLIKHDKNIENNTNSKLKYEIKNLEDSRKKFNRGVISYPEYLNNKSKLLSQEQEASKAKTQRLINYFTLYKAVGGQL